MLARPRTPPRRREGGGTNNPRFIKHTSPFRCNVRIRWYTRVTTRHFPRLTPYLATMPVFFLASTDAGVARTRDSSTRQSHAPRGAHTQRPNAFCNGDLWRETAEGPHDAPWITPPPASGAALCFWARALSWALPPSLCLYSPLSSQSLHFIFTRDRPTG